MVIPALVGLLAGFLASFLFTPRYTSQATLLEKIPNVPSGSVLLSTDIADEFGRLTRAALSPVHIRQAARNHGLVAPGQGEDQLIEDIRLHESETPQNLSGVLTAPIFFVKYTDSTPVRAQDICQLLVELIVEQSINEQNAPSEETYTFSADR